MGDIALRSVSRRSHAARDAFVGRTVGCKCSWYAGACGEVTR
jgi:hypothetical protein